MRNRAILLVLAVAALAAALPSGASAARYVVGIGEQKASVFSEPAFQATGVRHVRYLVPWDWRRNAGIRAEVRGYLAAARAAGKDVFVTFTARRGCFRNGRYLKARRCRAPSPRRYRKAVKQFRAEFGWIRTYAPWNEANHVSQPTARRPKLAARYWNVLRKVCRRCRLVAADVLDSSNVARYLRKFRRHAKGKPRRWGLHNYSDVNRRRLRGTKAVLRTVPGQVWLTETGGIVKFGRDFGYSERRAKARTRYLFRVADRYSTRRRGMRSKIRRVYPYSWYGEPRGARFDAGLTDPDGSPRPALRVYTRYAERRNR